MAKFTDFTTTPEVKDIMERFLDRFPQIFEGFKTDEIHFIMTLGKKSKFPIKLIPVSYPMDVFVNKPYIVEVFNDLWRDMNEKQKNLSVFHIMCSIPEGAFDETSNEYAKRKRPDINMYMLEFAACGGVADWFNNPMAKDPMDVEKDDIEHGMVALGAAMDREEAIPDEDGIVRMPVRRQDVAEIGLKKATA